MENMAHLQYLPGDPRLVDQLVCELKSKGIFDQFRKECIADVDTRPAYQNLRQRVESSVATFLSRQCWQPDLNKNQLREKLRKHLLDGNYLEQGVERIVDQVVNPKVATVFIPQVEDLVYNYLGIPRKKPSGAETSNGKVEDLLPTDLEAVSPGSVKSNEDKDMDVEETTVEKMDVDEKTKLDIKEDSAISIDKDKEESRLSGISELTIHDSDVSIDNSTATIPLPAEEIKLENIPTPENSPPNIKNINIDLEKIDLPKEPYLSTDIPLPDEIIKVEADSYFKPIALQSDDDDTSSDSSLRRNMSPLTPIRNFNNENSCDAQQAFENDSDGKVEDNKEPSSFRFTIEIKSPENSVDTPKTEKKDDNSPCQPNTQANVNTFNTPMYDDSSNSNNLQIDYESDANSKATDAKVPEQDQNSVDSKKGRKDDKKSSHKSSHSSRDSHRHSSSKDKERRSDSKHSTSRDSSRHDKSKSSKDDKAKSSHRDKNDKDRGDKKDSRDSSKHRPSSSHKSSLSTSHKDSKHRSSSSKHSSKDDRKSSSSSQRDKEKTSSDKSRDKSKDSKSSSKDKDRKSSKRSDEKENKEKKDKKETDDHYSLSGRGNPNRRSTDRDSNDGSSSSKGSHHPSHTKSGESKKDSKSISKSGSTSSDSTSPSDNVEVIEAKNVTQTKPVVRVDTHLETPVSTPPRLPFVPDVTLKKPRFAANLKEAKEMMKMRKFLEDEQKRMNQEAALLLEFQANVRPSLSQVYSSIPGPELEFACVSNSVQPTHTQVIVLDDPVKIEEQNEVKTDQESKESVKMDESEEKRDEIAETLIAMHCEGNSDMKIDDNDKNMVIDEEIEHDQVFYDNAVEQTEVVQNAEIKEETHASNEGDTVVNKIESKENIDLASKEEKATTDYEVAIVTEELSETEDKKDDIKKENEVNEEYKFQYFTETEKYAAEIEKDKFCNFFKSYTENLNNKFYLINCDTYEENLIKDAGKEIGTLEIVNYIKNGHLKKSASKAIVKNVNVTTEITLPTKMDYENEKLDTNHAMFSPVKSECSFELSSDYDAKLEEMVSKTSKQQVMEIILGGVIDESPSKMPQIDYCSDSNIEENSLKRKCNEIKSSNNNMHVLTPNKMRKLSGSDLISSTTEDTVETPSNKAASVARSKYLGKAKRVGLPKPKRTSNLPSSPSSDKSVENYEQNQTPNGKIKSTPRAKLPQRYDTSDLYKPKLHYLSRRNNIT